MSRRLSCLLLLAWLAPLAAVERVEFSARRIEGAGFVAQDLRASWAIGALATLDLQRLSGAAVPIAVEALQLRCARLQGSPGLSCDSGRIQAQLGPAGTLQAQVQAQFSQAQHWSLSLQELRAQLDYAHASGRYASERLRIEGGLQAQRRAQRIALQAELRLPAGQAYVEPVFADFSTHALQATLAAQLDLQARRLQIQRLHAEQAQVGVVAAQGRIDWRDRPQAELQLELESVQLAGAVELWLKPFLAGTRLDGLQAAGRARGQLAWQGQGPARIELALQGAQLSAPKLGTGLSGIGGALRWSQKGDAPSRLQIERLQVEKLAMGPAVLDFVASGRDFRLRAPLHVPVAGGALHIERLSVADAGAADMSAELQAEVEPIELHQLCRALGWPEFSGRLSGRLPGMVLKQHELSLQGALTAQAFEGDIRIANLRVLEPFSVLPRVAADLQLRNLDLEALTGAFSFGRIEGRLHGDVEGLRLIGWEPVAMNVHLYTPPDDRSRHRISQRAIDNISAIGGGPSGLLSRGVLRFFEDFAYARIGWSCVLENGVCRMDGLEPAPDNGYVLVKGRLLPRIDVIGYARRVNWRTFVQQLASVRDADKVEVRPGGG